MEQYVANMLWEYSALKSLFFSLKHKNIRHVVVVLKLGMKNGRMHFFLVQAENIVFLPASVLL